MQNRRALTSLALALSLLSGAIVVGAPAHAQRASFCGRARFVPDNCIVVRGNRAARTDFDISGARPAPRRNEMIAGSGLVRRGFSVCIRADRRLTAVTWRRVTACPMAR